MLIDTSIHLRTFLDMLYPIHHSLGGYIFGWIECRRGRAGKYGQVFSEGAKYGGGYSSWVLSFKRHGMHCFCFERYSVITLIFCVFILCGLRLMLLSIMWVPKSSMSSIWISEVDTKVPRDSWKIHHIPINGCTQQCDLPVPWHWPFHCPNTASSVTLVLPNWHHLSVLFVNTGKKHHRLGVSFVSKKY